MAFFCFSCFKWNFRSIFSLSEKLNELHKHIEQVDYEKDLEWWSSNYGIDLRVPQFIVCLLISLCFLFE